MKLLNLITLFANDKIMRDDSRKMIIEFDKNDNSFSK